MTPEIARHFETLRPAVSYSYGYREALAAIEAHVRSLDTVNHDLRARGDRIARDSRNLERVVAAERLTWEADRARLEALADERHDALHAERRAHDNARANVARLEAALRERDDWLDPGDLSDNEMKTLMVTREHLSPTAFRGTLRAIALRHSRMWRAALTPPQGAL